MKCTLLNIFYFILQNAEPAVCYHLCDYLICILNKIKNVAEFCIQTDVTKTPYSASEMSAFSQSFFTTIFQVR